MQRTKSKSPLAGIANHNRNTLQSLRDALGRIAWEFREDQTLSETEFRETLNRLASQAHNETERVLIQRYLDGDFATSGHIDFVNTFPPT